MVSGNSKLFFLISGCPGPFRLVKEWMLMLEEHGNRFQVELTLKPVEAGIELLGHRNELKVTFQAVLVGATTKYGHGVGDGRNVRLLGKFPMMPGVNPHVQTLRAVNELVKWQWEVVFNPHSRDLGFAAKLDTPLPEEWTL